MFQPTKIKLLVLVCFATLLLVHVPKSALSQENEHEFVFYFDNGKHSINHPDSISNIAHLLDSLEHDSKAVISYVEINSYTSPEGGVQYNSGLSEKRAASIYDVIVENSTINPASIVVKSNGIAWDQLQHMIAKYDVPFKEEVIDILRECPEEEWGKVSKSDRWRTLLNSRNKELMELRGGVPYNYLREHVYPHLRLTNLVVIYCTQNKMAAFEDTLKFDPIPVIPFSAVHNMGRGATDRREPFFAIKTNLLADVLTFANIEVEIPIKERWSISAEWMFPWWNTKDNRKYAQLLMGTIEAKYWFRTRKQTEVLTGHALGLHVSSGYYDFQWNKSGYQGEIVPMVGLSYSYAHKIGKHLRLEHSIAFGVLNTKYRKYRPNQDYSEFIWSNDGRTLWVGPTKAEVSLVWLINKRKRR